MIFRPQKVHKNGKIRVVRGDAGQGVQVEQGRACFHVKPSEHLKFLATKKQTQYTCRNQK
jgi:hypothetical protein